MADGDITLDAPPEVHKNPPVNPLAYVLPVAMLVAAGGMMALYFTSGGAASRGPMSMFFPVMMLASVVGSLAYGSRGANHTAQLNEVLRHLSAAGVRSLTSQPPTLEELFLRHYQAEEVTTPAGNGQSTREGAQR